MDEIIKMSSEIDYYNLVQKFKGSTKSINFTKFGGLMYTYDQLKKGKKALQQVEKEQKDFRSDLHETIVGNPKHKNESQLYTIKNGKNLTQGKKLLIYSMTIQKLDLKLFTK